MPAEIRFGKRAENETLNEEFEDILMGTVCFVNTRGFGGMKLRKTKMLALCGLAVAVSTMVLAADVSENTTKDGGMMPVFEVDPSWTKLPNGATGCRSSFIKGWRRRRQRMG